MRRLSFMWSALMLLAIAPVAAIAQAPGTLSYQGVLTDDDGIIVPDGNYSLTFRIYDVSAGGTALFTESQPAVPVERGGFSVALGVGAGGIALAFDRTYFLGIQVGADPELTPRVRLTAAPYSMGLRLPFVQSVASTSPLLDLNNTGTSLDARFRKRIEVGTSSASARIDVIGSGSTASQLEFYTTSLGGIVAASDEAGVPHCFMQPDPSGSGGDLTVLRSSFSAGFVVDGNFSGSGDPRVSILGAIRSAVFDMTQSGNPSVVLPTDAVSSVEQLDEPGVASATQPNAVLLDGTTQVLLSRTLTAPAAGYCLVMATAQATVSHTNGVTSTALFGVSDDPAILPTNQDVALSIPSGGATGTYLVPVAVHGLFPVAAGANTFYFLGDEGSGDLSWADGQLSLVYLPTAYGTVTPTLVAGTGDDLAQQPGPSTTDLAAEKAEAERFHRSRLKGELSLMRTQMDELRRQLDAVAAEQRAVRTGEQRP